MRERPLSTRISVPADDVDELMDALSRSGFVVLDRGERVTTEDAIDGEATLDLMRLPDVDDLEDVEADSPDPAAAPSNGG